MKIKTSDLVAYAVGYYHGRAIGDEQNPYDDDHHRSLYREGYDAGVADYSQDAHPEEVNA